MTKRDKIKKKYEIIEIINSGNFGNVILCEYGNERFAIKEEKETNSSISLIKHETKIYKDLKSLTNIPKFYESFKEKERLYLVIEYFDYTLSDFKTKDSKKPVNIDHIISTVLSTINEIHELGYVHRDLKPDNICLNAQLEPYLIDFGLSKQIIDIRNNGHKHIEFKTIKSLIGAENFVSLNIVNLCEPSRRDDIEAILYILIYMLLDTTTYNEYSRLQIREKKDLDVIKLFIMRMNERFKSLINLEAIINMFKYCRRMTFTQRPNYKYIKDTLF